MSMLLEKLAAFTIKRGTGPLKVVGGLPTTTKRSTTPPAGGSTTPPAGGGSTNPPPQQTPPQQQTPPKQEAPAKQPNPTVEAAKQDAKNIRDNIVGRMNKSTGLNNAADTVLKSNTVQNFLKSDKGQAFQQSGAGKWIMNNKGAAAGLAGAGLAAGGLAVGAAIKRHREKKKMKEQAQYNAQAMGKGAYEEIGEQLEKIASKANAKNFGYVGAGLGGYLGGAVGSWVGYGKARHRNKPRLNEIKQELKKDGLTKSEKRALRNERYDINREISLASTKGLLAGMAIGTGAGAGLGAGTGAMIGRSYKEPKPKTIRAKEPFDGKYYDGEISNKDGSKAASEGFNMYENIGAQLEKIAGAKDIMDKAIGLTGFGKKDRARLAKAKEQAKWDKGGFTGDAAEKDIKKIYGKRAATVGTSAALAGAAAGGAIALKKHLKKKKDEQKKEALDAAVAHLLEKEAVCKCKGKKGRNGNLFTDATKSDQSADVTGRGGDAQALQKKALDEAVAHLLSKAE